MSNTIDLKDLITSYGIHTLKMKCSATGYVDSDYTEETIDYQPRIDLDYINETIIFSHVMPSVTEYKIYGETTLLGTFTTSQASTDNIVISFSSLGISLSDYTYYSLTTTISNVTYTSNNTYARLVLGVSGLYDTSNSLTRTDDSVGKSYAIDSSNGTISSNFDKFFPYNQITKVTIGNNVFVKIPAMWFRIGKDSSGNLTDIAVSVSSDDNGTWYHTEEFYYAAHLGIVSNNKLLSQANVTPTANTPMNQLRTYASNNGSGYRILDVYHRTIINFLFMIEFATKYTYGIFAPSFNSLQLTGATNNISSSSGFLSNGRFKYRDIEDLSGNLSERVDGVHSNYTACNDYTKYSSPSNYSYMSYRNKFTTDQVINIRSFGWDDNFPFVCMPATGGSSSETTYFNANVRTSANTSIIYGFGGGYSDNNSNFYKSIFKVESYGQTETATGGSYGTQYGGRLIYVPSEVDN